MNALNGVKFYHMLQQLWSAYNEKCIRISGTVYKYLS